MIRWLFVEALRTLLSLLLVSIIAFVILDTAGVHDWYGTLAPGNAFGMSADEALLRNTPKLFVRSVEDATILTQRDLALLGNPQRRDAARARLLERGAVVVPTILEGLDARPPEVQREAFELLSRLSPALTGGATAPVDPARARRFWDNFRVMYEIDLRDAFARRHIQRIVDHDSPNARAQLARLGSLALPALFEALDSELETASARRLCAIASEITGRSRLIPEGATAQQTRAVVEAWRAWWFVHRLEYTRTGQTQRSLGHVTEARYGRWLLRALEGKLGPVRASGQGVLVEARGRLPRSTAVAGLGGLVATALVVAFGGGKQLRARPLKTKLVDLAAALIPGLVAFSVGFFALCSVVADRQGPVALVRSVLADWPEILAGIALVTGPAALFLRREQARIVLGAVRSEAESWVEESATPKPAQLLRHGARVGVASLLAPAALNALVILGLTVLVEPIAHVDGMGALTLVALTTNDGVWLQIAILSVVPVAIGTRWARTALLWALGGTRAVFAKPTVREGGDVESDVQNSQ